MVPGCAPSSSSDPCIKAGTDVIVSSYKFDIDKYYDEACGYSNRIDMMYGVQNDVNMTRVTARLS